MNFDDIYGIDLFRKHGFSDAELTAIVDNDLTDNFEPEQIVEYRNKGGKVINMSDSFIGSYATPAHFHQDMNTINVEEHNKQFIDWEKVASNVPLDNVIVVENYFYFNK